MQHMLRYGIKRDGDSFLGIDLAMSHSLEGRVGDTARLSAGSATNSFLLRMNRDDNVNWFHGKISRDAAEKLLKEGKKYITEGEDGVFLGEVVHYQIRRHGEDAFFSIEEHTTVHGLDTLIQHYRGDSNGLVTRLSVVCKGQPPPHESRTQGTTNLLHRESSGVFLPKTLATLVTPLGLQVSMGSSDHLFSGYHNQQGTLLVISLAISTCPSLATEAGDLNVVSQLLACGYRSRDAKNQDGQTAVHIAARAGRDDILVKLIESGATVNVRDTAGYTPLHYTCQNNLSSTTELLITKGNANYQMRHAPTGKVPLHEAAQKGHIECVKVLLRLKAPAHPRTLAKDTPADLAQQNGHTECYEILKTHKLETPKTSRSHWYHGTLNRDEALNLLEEYCKHHNLKDKAADGVFLVRYSEKHPNAYVLTMLNKNTPFNFIIRKESHWLFIDDGPYLESLERLIEHYSNVLDGLPNCLTVPVPPKPKPPLPEFSTMPRTKKPSPCRATLSLVKNDILNDRKGSLPNPTPVVPNNNAFELLTRNLSFTSGFNLSDTLNNNSFDESLSPDRDDTYKVPVNNSAVMSLAENYNEISINSDGQLSTRQEFIPMTELTLGSALGEGEFGSVLRATHHPPGHAPQSVAVKTLHIQHSDAEKQEFLSEAKIMTSLRHRCIVRLIGISLGPPLAMIQELVPLGSLLEFLLRHPDKASPSYELRLWACQVAAGMRYLESRRFVHRDLAARNILLASRHQAKISDFGLSRALSADSSYYRASRGGKWPIKWYAPESYNYGTFSHASDVWSYGVTLWEMFSYGKQPYGDMRGSEAIQLVEEGKRLERPLNCPDEIYQVMMDCWAYTPSARPTFNRLVEVFSQHPDYVNISQIALDTEDTLNN
ncbi:Tyrosine-protein kinase HTK16 [Eumeta japonica]|uniref:Tyrosine-protein kinase n=1 Tax=Eumeta variegata TaxID=151549 RepID=A0A4C1TA74_EUMVA|nr:Tyrosine-protein kinase HTK16 [Eumeta japonica]